MPSPFPGMDPYLENPARWPGLHFNLIGQIQAQLNNSLSPNLVAMIEERVYISSPVDPGRPRNIIPDVYVSDSPATDTEMRTSQEAATGLIEPIEVELPDEEVHDHFISISTVDELEVITVIEVLSPTNKIHGSIGQQQFLDKRKHVLGSATNWVEIDLLRAGDRYVPEEVVGRGDYFINTVKAGTRRGLVWAVKIPQPLPAFEIPLRPNEKPVRLDLQRTLNEVYRSGGYGRVVRYDRPAVPPIPPQYAEWAADLLKKRGQVS